MPNSVDEVKLRIERVLLNFGVPGPECAESILSLVGDGVFGLDEFVDAAVKSKFRRGMGRRTGEESVISAVCTWYFLVLKTSTSMIVSRCEHLMLEGQGMALSIQTRQPSR